MSAKCPSCAKQDWLKRSAVAPYEKWRIVEQDVWGCPAQGLSAGKHSDLIRAIIEEFVPRFVPGGELVYVGDTGTKWGYFDEKLLHTLGVKVGSHGKMPDVVVYYRERNWLVLVEAVASSGPASSCRSAAMRLRSSS